MLDSRTTVFMPSTEPSADNTARPLNTADISQSESDTLAPTESEFFEQLRVLQEHESSAAFESTALDKLYSHTITAIAA